MTGDKSSPSRDSWLGDRVAGSLQARVSVLLGGVLWVSAEGQPTDLVWVLQGHVFLPLIMGWMSFRLCCGWRANEIVYCCNNGVRYIFPGSPLKLTSLESLLLLHTLYKPGSIPGCEWTPMVTVADSVHVSETPIGPSGGWSTGCVEQRTERAAGLPVYLVCLKYREAFNCYCGCNVLICFMMLTARNWLYSLSSLVFLPLSLSYPLLFALYLQKGSRACPVAFDSKLAPWCRGSRFTPRGAPVVSTPRPAAPA